MEEIAIIHINSYSKFLGKKIIPSKVNARQKLGKLTINQFSELSTDVYDELQRRNQDSEPFLIPREDMHPRRNQARQKLATLSINRFEELVSDVFNELTARFPHIKPEDSLKISIPKERENPLPQPPSSSGKPLFNDSERPAYVNTNRNANTIANPNSNPTKNINGSNFKSLDNLMADLGGMLSPSAFDSMPEDKLNRNASGPTNTKFLPEFSKSEAHGEEIETLRKELFHKTEELEKLNSSIKNYRTMEKEYKELHKAFSQLKEKYAELDRESSELRLESTNLASELKSLSVENSSLRAAKQKSTSQIDELFIQIQDWKTKYEDELRKRKKLENELSNLEREKMGSTMTRSTTKSNKPRPSSIIEKLKSKRTNPNIDFEDDGIRGNQIISKSILDDYYAAVNEILSEARSREEPNTNILMAMKNIVHSCKSISQDIESFEKDLSGKSLRSPTVNMALSKQDMTQTLTYLMGLAKQFAVDPEDGLRTDIEEAVTALSGVIVEMYGNTEMILKSFDLNNNQPNSGGNDQEIETDDSLSNLKSFLEQETDQIVKSIQSLLVNLKSPKLNNLELDSSLNTIFSIVSALIDTCEGPVRAVKSDSCDDIFQLLSENQDRLFTLGEKLKDEPGSKVLKQQIASTAYEIAKVLKRLIEVI